MRRSILLCSLSLIAFFALIPGMTPFPITGRMSLHTQSVSRTPAHGAPNGDIWVYGGALCFWDGTALRLDEELGAKEFYTRFLNESPYRESAMPVSGGSLLSGALDGRSMYVLDDTPLTFGELTLNEIIAYGELNIESGILRAASIRAADGVFVGTGCKLYVEREISSGGFIECCGGVIEAGSLDARRIWFDSAGAELHVSVSGSALTGYYTQEGGEVTIGGGLYSLVTDPGDKRAGISVNGEYAKHNETSLKVGGDIVSAGEAGSIEIGGGTAFGGLDETGLRVYQSLRSGKKDGGLPDYAHTDKSAEHLQDVTVWVGGDMKASRSASFFAGNTFIRGVLELRGTDGGVSIFGGVLNASDMRVAGRLDIGTENDYYGLNDEITVFIANEIRVDGAVNVAGGTVYEGILLG